MLALVLSLFEKLLTYTVKQKYFMLRLSYQVRSESLEKEL